MMLWDNLSYPWSFKLSWLIHTACPGGTQRAHCEPQHLLMTVILVPFLLSLCSSQISVLIPLEALLQDHLQLVMKCFSLFSRIVFFFLVFALILVLTCAFFTKVDSVHLNRHIFSSSTITNLSTGLHLCSYFFDSIQLSTLWVRVQDND